MTALQAALPAEAVRAPAPALAPPATRPLLSASWARHADEVREAQALRFRVFMQEMGASVDHADAREQLDVDRFDAHCEHLIVRRSEDGQSAGPVVGTYRLLTPEGARRAGGLYSEQAFDIARLAPLRPRLVELGRACVDPAYRHGSVVLLLWSQIGRFMRQNDLGWLLGCASVSMRDSGHHAASLWCTLSRDHLAEPERLVQPRRRLPWASLHTDLEMPPPPLMRAYLRCGAQVLGEPAWDPAFRTADFPLLLDVKRLPQQHHAHFIER